MSIDHTRLISATTRGAQAGAKQLAARKGDCRARIFAVVGDTAQINLAAAAAAGVLDAGQMTTYRAGLSWIAGMRAACASGNWPDLPAGVKQLAAAF